MVVKVPLLPSVARLSASEPILQVRNDTLHVKQGLMSTSGSIRIPAACCGTYGFKPTAARLPAGGQASGGLPGLRAMLSAAGPLANDFDGLGILTREIIDAVPAKTDVSSLDIPWRRLTTTRTKLRIGIFPEEPLYPLQPPVKRALAEAVNVLKEAGHELVSIDTSEAQLNACSEVAWELMALDPGRTSIRHITSIGEPFVPSVSTREPPTNFGNFEFVQSDVTNLDPFHRYAAVNLKRDELQESWMRRIWTEKNLDVVIGPVARSSAVVHDTFGWPFYTVFVNVLDVSSPYVGSRSAEKETDLTAEAVPFVCGPLFAGVEETGSVGRDKEERRARSRL